MIEVLFSGLAKEGLLLHPIIAVSSMTFSRCRYCFLFKGPQVRAARLQNETAPRKMFKSIRKTV